MSAQDIKPYLHTAQYHETDQMGIIHHANFIKWLEEARIDYLNQRGMSYRAMEEAGLISPIVEVTCRYKNMVRFGDTVAIEIHVAKYTGVKLVLAYTVTNTADGVLCAKAETTSCFMNRDGRLLSLASAYPALHTLLAEEKPAENIANL